jgi:chemotaxis protein MotA
MMNFDLASLLGTILGFVGIVGGQLLEGGHIEQILQLTAALIVFGGTLGAIFLAFPMSDIRRAFSMIPSVYMDSHSEMGPLIDEIVKAATVARKEGLLAIEPLRASMTHPLFKKSIKYVIDGFEPATVREIIETEIERGLDEDENAAKVFEGAAGFAPTIGILGAVLGLIHVMTMLNEPSKIGEGIAVAFVATLYGLGLANLVLLPWAMKLKRKAAERSMAREIVKMGVIAIQEGQNPNFLQEKLEVYAHQSSRKKPAPSGAKK